MRFYDELTSLKEQIGFDERFVPLRKYDNIVLSGMGGSAIAGMLFSDLFSSVPVTVVNGYDVPDFINENSLFIAISHSGNTEETLSALENATSRGAQIFIITTGGKMASMQGEKIIVPKGLQPRSSIGYLLMPLLRTFGLVDEDIQANTVEAIDRVLGMTDEIRPLAESIVENEKIPVVYGIPPSQTVAYRWKTQFNENSKIMAHSSTLPEMNHNEIAALPYSFLKDRFEFLVAGIPVGKYLSRVRISEKIAGVKFHLMPEISGEPVPSMFASIMYGDMLSYFVAEARKVDPREVSAIESLKAELAKTD